VRGERRLQGFDLEKRGNAVKEEGYVAEALVMKSCRLWAAG
jgi:hypothetical protein